MSTLFSILLPSSIAHALARSSSSSPALSPSSRAVEPCCCAPLPEPGQASVSPFRMSALCLPVASCPAPPALAPPTA
eukprot:3944020-Pleurochrysis_carterae.AAC.1